MDSEKASFLAGADEPEPDEYEPASGAGGVIRGALARQIHDDDPPQVWQTAQRLLATGMDASDTMRQLVLTGSRSTCSTRVRSRWSRRTSSWTSPRSSTVSCSRTG